MSASDNYDWGDPWRYRCPHCESVSFTKRKIRDTRGFRQSITYSDDSTSNRGPQEQCKDLDQFRCDSCSETFDDPIDMKEQYDE